MSLYHHFDGRVALVDGVVDALAREIEIPPPGSLSWQDSSRTIVRTFRELGRRFPSASQLLLVNEQPAEETVARSQGAIDHLLAR